MIIYEKGDVLKSEANIIAHGVNCVGGFGAGIAGQIAKKHPIVKKEYLSKFYSDDWKLGEVQYVEIEYSGVDVVKFIANCSTQIDYKPKGILHCDYEALETCMNNLKCTCLNNNYTLAMPKIGCGLAGGNWELVSRIIENVFGDDMDVFVYEL